MLVSCLIAIMTKRAYDVNETKVGPTKDGSFRSCLCAMLIFFSICVIIIILAWPWRNSDGNKQPQSGNKEGTAFEQTGSKYPAAKTEKNENKVEKESIKPKQENKPSKPLLTTELTTEEISTTQKSSKYSSTDKKPTEKPKLFERQEMSTEKTKELTEIPTTVISKDDTENINEKIKKDKFEKLIYSTENLVTTESTTANPRNDNSTEKNLSPEPENLTTLIPIIKTTNLSNSDKNNTNYTESHLINDKNNVTQNPEDVTTQINENITKTFINNRNIMLVTYEDDLTTETIEITSTISSTNEDRTTEGNKIIETTTDSQFNGIDNTVTTETIDETTTYKTIEEENNRTTAVTSLKKIESREESTTQTSDTIKTTEHYEKLKINKEEEITTIISKFNETNDEITTEYISELTTLRNFETTRKPPEITTTQSSHQEQTLEIMETDEPESRITTPPKQNHRDITQDRTVDKDLCNAQCKETGARILSKINYFADPCEQFYDYVCGGDHSNYNSANNWGRIAGEMDKIQKKSPKVYKIFRKYYDTCVEFHTDYDIDKRIADAKYILSLVGQAYKADDNETASLTDLLTKLLQLDSSPLFDISVDVDKESQHFIFQLNIGKKFSQTQDDITHLTTKRKCIQESKKHFDFSVSFFNSINLNEMHQKYSNCLQNTSGYIEILDKAIDILGVYDELESSIENVEEILEKYKQLPSVTNIRRDIVTKKFIVRKVSELMFHYPLIDWKKILENLVGKDVHDEDLVQVYFSDFFFTMFSRKQTLTKTEIHNAVLAMFVHDLYTNLVLPTQMSNVEEYCLHHSSDLMKEVASSLYLDTVTSKDIEGDLRRVEELFNKMKNKLVDFISEADWVSGARLTLIRKINSMELDTWNRSLVWKNMTLLEQRMQSVLDGNFGNYSEFFVALTRRSRGVLYGMWDTMAYAEENVWWCYLTPYSTSPVSIYALNRIALPPPMLLKNTKDLPRYLSLAKLGFSLAKAMGYHFDTTGSKYSVSLDRKSNNTYEATRVCMADSYKNQIEVENDGKSLQFRVTNESLNLSFNERFVEDMAINLTSVLLLDDLDDYQLSWVSSSFLKDMFTNEKMFFIALGQEHCQKLTLDDFFLRLFENEHLPPSVLLDVSISHSEMFTEVFGCREGARVNAMFKCKPFPEMQESDYDDTEY